MFVFRNVLLSHTRGKNGRVRWGILCWLFDLFAGRMICGRSRAGDRCRNWVGSLDHESHSVTSAQTICSSISRLDKAGINGREGVPHRSVQK
jgi:hypothetical protein